jgi:hypothetical protein
MATELTKAQILVELRTIKELLSKYDAAAYHRSLRVFEYDHELRNRLNGLVEQLAVAVRAESK